MLAILFFIVSLCDPRQWAHTYHKQRFTIISQCRCMSGTIVAIKPEADGDDHIRALPDERGLLNHLNMTRQHGLMVVEPVCVHPVKQQSAMAACRGVVPVWVPPVGAHVRWCGVYARDDEHGWMESHAVVFTQK